MVEFRRRRRRLDFPQRLDISLGEILQAEHLSIPLPHVFDSAISRVDFN
jgi:hypothetical protein